MKAYPKYKDSEVAWLGTIPNEWYVFRAKHIFKQVNRPVRPQDEIITAFRDGQVTLRSKRRTKGFTNSLKEIGYKSVRENDLLIHSMDGFAGAIGISDSNGKCSPVCSVCVPLESDKINMIYYGYLVRQLAITDFITSLAKGIRERSTEFRYNEFANLKLPIPLVFEQEQIASYLDHKTQQIDTLIEKKQRLIKLLKEERTAVINEAVTKGLDPNAPMKDSGIEWLGEIPEHWNISALKHYIAVIDCKHITAPFFDSGYPLASIKEVKQWKVDLSSSKYTNEEYYNLLTDGNRKPIAGDIIYSRNATVGESALVTEQHPDFAMGQDVCTLRVVKMCDPNSILYSLKSHLILTQLDMVLIGSTFKRINVEAIKAYSILLPPIAEQSKIVSYLNSETSRIDTIITKANKEIELLYEYRTALIGEVVTGKIDVRDWEKPENDSNTH